MDKAHSKSDREQTAQALVVISEHWHRWLVAVEDMEGKVWEVSSKTGRQSLSIILWDGVVARA